MEVSQPNNEYKTTQSLKAASHVYGHEASLYLL